MKELHSEGSGNGIYRVRIKKVGEEVNEVGGHFGVSGLGEPTLE